MHQYILESEKYQANHELTQDKTQDMLYIG